MRTNTTRSVLMAAGMLCLSLIARADKVDDFVTAAMKTRKTPGAAIAIIQNGKPLIVKGYGLANVELKVPATQETRFELASVTKQFTSMAVMMLVEEGKIKLDDKITQLLKDLPTTWEAVTVRNLLNHTSGIKSYTELPSFAETTRKDYTQKELIQLVADKPLDFAPGEKWNYNNTGYFLLGMLIEKISGKSYGDFLKERVFQPLGMNATRVNNFREIIPNRAFGYSAIGGKLENCEYVSPTQPFSAGALVSSVSDMVKWDAALTEGKFLSHAGYEQLWAPTRLKDGKMQEYGFGWAVEKMNGHRAIHHSGGIPGFSTNILRLPDDKLTVIVLCNEENARADALSRGIAGLYIPGLVEKPAQPIADSDPATTQKLKTFFTDALEGKVEPALFTADAQANLVPKIKESQPFLKTLGPLKSFTLLEAKSDEKGKQYRYRAACANQTVVLGFFLTNESKIQGIMLRPE